MIFIGLENVVQVAKLPNKIPVKNVFDLGYVLIRIDDVARTCMPKREISRDSKEKVRFVFEELLDIFYGNLSEIARYTKINRQVALYIRMKRFGIKYKDGRSKHKKRSAAEIEEMIGKRYALLKVGDVVRMSMTHKAKDISEDAIKTIQDVLCELLKKYNGNVKRAAGYIGLDRRDLHRCLKKHGVVANDYRKTPYLRSSNN